MASNIIREKWFGWGWKGPKGTPYSVTPTSVAPSKSSKKAPPKR
jgi:hypothetical protein